MLTYAYISININTWQGEWRASYLWCIPPGLRTCCASNSTGGALSPVFLDTETTGLDAGAQALEIGLVNARGEKIFETRLKTTVGIDPAAAAVQIVTEPYRFPVLSVRLA